MFLNVFKYMYLKYINIVRTYLLKNVFFWETLHLQSQVKKLENCNKKKTLKD